MSRDRSEYLSPALVSEWYDCHVLANLSSSQSVIFLITTRSQTSEHHFTSEYFTQSQALVFEICIFRELNATS